MNKMEWTFFLNKTLYLYVSNMPSAHLYFSLRLTYVLQLVNQLYINIHLLDSILSDFILDAVSFILEPYLSPNVNDCLWNSSPVITVTFFISKLACCLTFLTLIQIASNSSLVLELCVNSFLITCMAWALLTVLHK